MASSRMQPGVNERFRDGLVDRFQLFFFVKPNEAVFIHDPTDHAFEMVLTAHSWLENILLADSARARGPHRLHGRVLRPLLCSSRSSAGSPALRCFDRPRLLLDDRVDQRGAAAIAGSNKVTWQHKPSTTHRIVAASRKQNCICISKARSVLIRRLNSRRGMGRHSRAKKLRLATTIPISLGFIETFKWITSFLRTPDDYALITRHLAKNSCGRMLCMRKSRFPRA